MTVTIAGLQVEESLATFVADDLLPGLGIAAEVHADRAMTSQDKARRPSKRPSEEPVRAGHRADRDAARGHVGHRVDARPRLVVAGQGQAGLGVDPGRHEELLAQGPAELGDLAVDAEFGDKSPHQFVHFSNAPPALTAGQRH